VIYPRLGIPTVATVAWTTDQVLRRLIPEQMEPTWTDGTGAVSMVERPLPPRWAGHPLSELDEGDRYRVVAITRGGKAQLVSRGMIGQDGDVLHIAVQRDALAELADRLATTVAGGH
jgi:trk system potassium uptake protein TrkA